MNDQVGIQMSQGLVVLPPRSGQAYPIPCEEWALLKTKIARVASEPWLFHTVGSVLAGAAASTLISILLGAFETQPQRTYLVVAWAVFATTAISAALCLFFAHQQREAARERAGDVVAQMDLIEKRYERTPS